MNDELLTQIQTHDALLGELVDATQRRDNLAIGGGLVALVGELVTELPLVGKLARAGYRELIARSAQGQLDAALARLRADDAAEAQRQAVAGAVAELLSEALAGLAEGVEGVKSRLDALDERRGKVTVRQGEVSAGVGTHVRADAKQDVDITQGHIRGGVGVIIGD